MSLTSIRNPLEISGESAATASERIALRLEQSIVALLILLATAIPVWTKAAVLLFRVALVLWIVKLIFSRKGLKLPLAAPLLLFLMLTAISSAYSPEPALSWGRMRLVALLLLSLLVAANVRTLRQLQWMVTGLMLSTLVTVMDAVWQYETKVKKQFRVHGFFNHYVPYSEFLMLAGGVLWGLVLAAILARQKKASIWMGALLAAYCAALLLTETRAALAALVLSASITLWQVAKWKLRAISLAALVVVCVAGSIWFQKVRAGQGWFSRKDPGTDYRILMWEDGIRLAREHPWVGIGMDTAETHGEELGIRAYKKYPKLKSHFHSSPIQIAAECGLLALAAWIWLMAANLLLQWRLAKSLFVGLVARGLALGLLTSTMALLMVALVHYITGDAEVMILFWLLAGMGIVLQAIQSDDHSDHRLTKQTKIGVE